MKIARILAVMAFILVSHYLFRQIEPKVCINSRFVNKVGSSEGLQVLHCIDYLKNPYLYPRGHKLDKFKKLVTELNQFEEVHGLSITGAPSNIYVSSSIDYPAIGEGVLILPDRFLNQTEGLTEILLVYMSNSGSWKSPDWHNVLRAKTTWYLNKKHKSKPRLKSQMENCSDPNYLLRSVACDLDSDHSNFWEFTDSIAFALASKLEGFNWKKRHRYLNSLKSLIGENRTLELTQDLRALNQSILELIDDVPSTSFKNLEVVSTPESVNGIVWGAPEELNKVININSQFIFDGQLVRQGLWGRDFLNTSETENIWVVSCGDLSLKQVLSFSPAKKIIHVDSCGERKIVIPENFNAVEFSKENPDLLFRKIDIKSAVLAQKYFPIDEAEKLSIEMVKTWMKWGTPKFDDLQKIYRPSGILDIIESYN